MCVHVCVFHSHPSIARSALLHDSSHSLHSCVRINKDNTISIAILSKYQKRGIATASLKEITENHSNLLNAEIFSDNIVSLKLFRKFPEIKLNILDAQLSIDSV